MSAWRNKTHKQADWTIGRIGRTVAGIRANRKSSCKVEFLAALTILSLAFQLEAATIVNDRLISAIGFVESRNRDGVIGDRGRAVGRFQMHQAAVIDAHNFSRSTSGRQRQGLTCAALSLVDKQGVAATVEEGTARKRVYVNDRTQRNIAFKGDSRKDGTISRRDAYWYCLWLESQLRREMKRQPTAGEIYAAYNCGLTGFERRRFRINQCPTNTRNAVAQIERRMK